MSRNQRISELIDTIDEETGHRLLGKVLLHRALRRYAEETGFGGPHGG